MMSRYCGFPFVLMLMFAGGVTSPAVGQSYDPADLPSPMTTAKVEAPSLLDELGEGPIKSRPYRWMVDDPVTPVSESTISPFVTVVDDVDPHDILERPGVPVGWYTDLEVTAANPRISTRQQSGDQLSGTFVNPVSVPTAPLDWTAMPKFTLGYRRAEGLGDLSASYRFLFSQGSDSIPSIGGGPGSGTSSLQLHVLDLDCSFSDLFPNDLWLVPRQTRLTAGVRVAGMNDKNSASGGNILGQSASNTFVGAGPRFALESNYPIATGRWTIFSKADAAGLIGNDSQSFSQTTAGPGGASGSASSTSTVAVPVIGVRAGVNWLPTWGGGNVKMSTGYQWERWFDVGATSSFNELTIQGPFLRGELAF